MRSSCARWSPGTGALLRIVWMFVGLAALGLTLGIVSQQSRGQLTWLDGLFWGLVAASLAARYLDVTRCEGTTADGEPATMAHVRAYAARLIPTALVTWGALHVSGLGSS